MRVWIDVSNSPQVPFFRPLITLLEARGHEVAVTTRDYAQTVELLRPARHPPRRGRPAPRWGERAGESRAMAARLPALRRWAKRRQLRPCPLARVARAPAGRPHARHPVRVRVRLRVRACPARARLPRGNARRRAGRDPAGRASTGSARAPEGSPLPGLEGGVLPLGLRAGRRRCSTNSGSTDDRVIVAVRPPPDVSLYHRHDNPLFADVLRRLGLGPGRTGGRPPANSEQRTAIAASTCRRS